MPSKGRKNISIYTGDLSKRVAGFPRFLFCLPIYILCYLPLSKYHPWRSTKHANSNHLPVQFFLTTIAMPACDKKKFKRKTCQNSFFNAPLYHSPLNIWRQRPCAWRTFPHIQFFCYQLDPSVLSCSPARGP